MLGNLGILKSEDKKRLFLSPSLTLEELKGYMSAFVDEVESKGTENSWTNSNYGMSKLGVIAMTRALAAREPGMRINCYCPGYCDTDMTSHKGPRSPAQGAETGVMLATIGKDGPTGKLFSEGVEAKW